MKCFLKFKYFNIENWNLVWLITYKVDFLWNLHSAPEKSIIGYRELGDTKRVF